MSFTTKMCAVTLFLVIASSGTEASGDNEAPSGIPPPPPYYSAGKINWRALEREIAARPLHPPAVTDQWLDDEQRPLLEEEAERILDYLGGEDKGLRWLHRLYNEETRIQCPITDMYQYRLDYENSNEQRSVYEESECAEWLRRPINWAAYIRGVDESREWPRRKKHDNYYTLAHVAALSKRNETKKDHRGTHGARIIMELLDLGERDALWAKSCSGHKPDPKNGVTPMFIAAQNSRPDVLRVFLSHPSTEHYLSEADVHEMLFELDFKLCQHQRAEITWKTKTGKSQMEDDIKDDTARTKECIELLKSYVSFRDELDAPWKEYRDPSNIVMKYYHNWDTGVTQRKRPEQMEFNIDGDRIPFFGIEQLVLQNIISRRCSEVSGAYQSLPHIANNLLTQLTPHGKIVKMSVSPNEEHSLHRAFVTMKVRDEYRERLRQQVLAKHYQTFYVDWEARELAYIRQKNREWGIASDTDSDEETTREEPVGALHSFVETPPEESQLEWQSDWESEPESDGETGWQVVVSRRNKRRPGNQYADEFVG